VAHAENHEATLEEDIATAREERKALPDMRVTANQMVAEKDIVVVYWTAVGTNTQAGMGFPATGKRSKLMARHDVVPRQIGKDLRRMECLGHALGHAASRSGWFVAVSAQPSNSHASALWRPSSFRRPFESVA
jgi:hypothetical protein